MPANVSTFTLILAFILLPLGITSAANVRNQGRDASVLILGGGVAGVIAAPTLHERGHDKFLILEARDELGGRMQNKTFGRLGRQFTVEQGPNWVQGTQTGNGPANPIFELVKKHDVKTKFNDFFGSMSFYDFDGPIDASSQLKEQSDSFADLTVQAGARLQRRQLDLNARTGYSLVGSKPKSHIEQAAEYYLFDWEYAQTPEQTSWIASAMINNRTFVPEQGGFSDENLLCVDPRGFKRMIQEEAAEFLKPDQVQLSSIVRFIRYSKSGVSVITTDGRTFEADYALVTFSIGVLQNDDVTFERALPDWKQEAIQSIVMATYTKIFFQFPGVFWFDTEMGLYADRERGRYTVWQSLDHEGFLLGSGIIFVTVTGDFSERIESLPDAQVKSEALSVLRLMFPNTTIPEPTDFFFPRWHTDPLFRGSYSNVPAAFVPVHHLNLRTTVQERLWFAGEATSEAFFGFLHGAYFEGRDVANEIADCVEAEVGECNGLQHIEEIML